MPAQVGRAMQKQIIRSIRRAYERMTGWKCKVEPFVILRSNGYSGCYTVTLCRDAVWMYSVDVRPKVDA